MTSTPWQIYTFLHEFKLLIYYWYLYRENWPQCCGLFCEFISLYTNEFYVCFQLLIYAILTNGEVFAVAQHSFNTKYLALFTNINNKNFLPFSRIPCAVLCVAAGGMVVLAFTEHCFLATVYIAWIIIKVCNISYLFSTRFYTFINEVITLVVWKWDLLTCWLFTRCHCFKQDLLLHAVYVLVYV